MRRRTAIACVTGVALAGLALVVAPCGPAPSPVPAPRRTDAPPPAPAPLPLAETPAPRQARIGAIEGSVQRRTAGAWTDAHEDDTLQGSDAIRTGADSTARLDIGGEATVHVAAQSEFSVAELSQRISRVRLDSGRITATVRGEGAELTVEVDGSDTIVSGAKGTFSVHTDSRGYVGIGSIDARVRVSANERTVELGDNEQSFVHPRSAPTPPVAIPSSLFLKVGRPKRLATRERTLPLAGTATPGVIVSVGGVRTAPSPSGAFRVDVPLKEGSNALVVEAEDVFGRRERFAVGDVVLDTRPPDVESKVEWK